MMVHMAGMLVMRSAGQRDTIDRTYLGNGYAANLRRTRCEHGHG